MSDARLFRIPQQKQSRRAAEEGAGSFADARLDIVAVVDRESFHEAIDKPLASVTNRIDVDAWKRLCLDLGQELHDAGVESIDKPKGAVLWHKMVVKEAAVEVTRG